MKRIALLLSALLLMSCGDDGVRPHTDDFVVSAAIAQPSFRLGDSTAIRITMTNNSTTSAVVVGSGCEIWFQVFRNEVSVYPAHVNCNASARSISIAAGASYAVTQYWKGETYVGAQGHLELLPPADYTLQASARYVLQSESGGIARSALIPLTLLPVR